jgi:hypothetical protein
MCWSHGEEYASLGMVIVSPDYQRQGLGRKLMSLVLEELGDRTTLLKATPQGRPLYEKMGFQTYGEIRQHQGTVFQSQIVPLIPGERIRPIGSSDRAKIAELSMRAVGMPRGTVLADLLKVAEGGVVIDRYDEVIGCAILRRFGHGYAIGPVIAPDVARAKALISHWAGSYAGAFMRIDVTGASGLSPWLSDLGLIQVDNVITMVRGEPPLLDQNSHQYAIISQALG